MNSATEEPGGSRTDATAIVFCRDARGDMHIARSDGRRWTLPRRRADGMSAIDLLAMCVDESARRARDVTPTEYA